MMSLPPLPERGTYTTSPLYNVRFLVIACLAVTARYGNFACPKSHRPPLVTVSPILIQFAGGALHALLPE